MIDAFAIALILCGLLAIAWLRRRRTYVIHVDASLLAHRLRSLLPLSPDPELPRSLVEFSRCSEQVVEAFDPNPTPARAGEHVVKFELADGARSCLLAAWAANRKADRERVTHPSGVSRA